MRRRSENILYYIVTTQTQAISQSASESQSSQKVQSTHLQEKLATQLTVCKEQIEGLPKSHFDSVIEKILCRLGLRTYMRRNRRHNLAVKRLCLSIHPDGFRNNFNLID